MAEEKIMFQYVMNYKAYRRIAISLRLAATVIVAGGLAVFWIKSIILGILLPVMALFIGAIVTLAALPVERSYTVYNTRIVLKKRNSQKRGDVNIPDIVSVSCRSAVYERDLGTGTVTVVAKQNGKKKRYRLKHIFDPMPLVEYLNQRISER